MERAQELGPRLAGVEGAAEGVLDELLAAAGGGAARALPWFLLCCAYAREAGERSPRALSEKRSVQVSTDASLANKA